MLESFLNMQEVQREEVVVCHSAEVDVNTVVKHNASKEQETSMFFKAYFCKKCQFLFEISIFMVTIFIADMVPLFAQDGN